MGNFQTDICFCDNLAKDSVRIVLMITPESRPEFFSEFLPLVCGNMQSETSSFLPLSELKGMEPTCRRRLADHHSECDSKSLEQAAIDDCDDYKETDAPVVGFCSVERDFSRFNRF